MDSSEVHSYPQRKKVLIVGGGFAGVSAYRTLRVHKDYLDVLLISDNESFVHIPLIHEVATGGLPEDVVHWPVTRYVACSKEHFLHARVTSVDADKRLVQIETPDGAHETHPYDFLILAVGSEPTMTNIPGAEKHVHTLRTLSDARALKKHILQCFAEAEKTKDKEEKKALLSFVVIGAGVTGLELVGELSNLFSNELSKKHPGCCDAVRIMLVNNKEKITIGNKEWLSEMAEERIKELPLVEMFHGATVSEIKKDGFVVNGKLVPARTVIWTGGVAAVHVPISAQPPVSRDERNRVVVGTRLTLENHLELFVVGDEAHVPKEDGSSYGMQAQFAVREGKHAAKNIIRALRGRPAKKFRTHETAFLLPIGKQYGIAEVFGFQFTGIIAWHLAHIVYVFSVVGWGLKLEVAWKWLYHLMKRRKTV